MRFTLSKSATVRDRSVAFQPRRKPIAVRTLMTTGRRPYLKMRPDVNQLRMCRVVARAVCWLGSSVGSIPSHPHRCLDTQVVRQHLPPAVRRIASRLDHKSGRLGRACAAWRLHGVIEDAARVARESDGGLTPPRSDEQRGERDDAFVMQEYRDIGTGEGPAGNIVIPYPSAMCRRRLQPANA
jgi:hypothetical protein